MSLSEITLFNYLLAYCLSSEIGSELREGRDFVSFTVYISFYDNPE